MRKLSDYAKLSIALNREKIRLYFWVCITLTLTLDQEYKGVSRAMALTSDQGRTEQTRVMTEGKDISEPVFSRERVREGKDWRGTPQRVPGSWRAALNSSTLTHPGVLIAVGHSIVLNYKEFNF